MPTVSPKHPPGDDVPCTQVINTMLVDQRHPLHSDEPSSTLADNTNIKNDLGSLTFPWKLHSLLEAAANEGFDHIVSWLNNDVSFKIHEPALFVKHVMPRFFKRQSKYKSFQRQLNMWQFQRVFGSKGPCNGGYFHVFFHRHDTSKFHLMKRSKLGPLSPSFQERSAHSNCLEDDLSDNFEAPTLQHPRKCVVTREPESLHSFHEKWGMFFCEQSVDTNVPSLDVDIAAPYGARSSVPYEAWTIHSDFVNHDAPRSQYPHIVEREFQPFTSPVGVLPNPWQVWEQKIESSIESFGCGHQAEPSPEAVADHQLISPLGDDFAGDALPLHYKNDIGSTDWEVSSPGLSADEWKYVLVGMKIAMMGG